MKKILFLQHVDFEAPANLKTWADKNEYRYTIARADKNIPDHDFDALVIMGGPMGTYEVGKYPWLKDEKKFIEKAIKQDKKVLGVCLGSQLIADVLGAKVYKHKHKEIGWFPVSLQTKNDKLFKNFPENPEVMHWHGDTFDLPKGARLLARNEATTNQAFAYGNNVAAIQFHIETEAGDIKNWLKHSPDLKPQPYVQKAEQILADSEKFSVLRNYCDLFMDNFLKRHSPS